MTCHRGHFSGLLPQCVNRRLFAYFDLTDGFQLDQSDTNTK